MKRCYICDELKPLTEFHKASDKPDGYRNDCKECRRTGRKVDVNAKKMRCSTCGELKDKNENNFHPSKKRKFGYRRCCKECHRKYQKNSHLIRLYNLTIDEYNKMVEEQNNKCLICNKVSKLFVDHDHLTGEVRGLLCDSCNRGIGHLQENSFNLLNAINYLNPNIDNEKWDNLFKSFKKQLEKLPFVFIMNIALFL